MYCPNCSAPIDGVKFCRSCGANVSLVPQAMSGRLPVQPAIEHDGPITVGVFTRKELRQRKRHRPPSVAKGIQEMFMGLGFVLVSLALSSSRTGNGWWFWLLIPAFIFLGNGVAEIVRAKQAEPAAPYNPPVAPLQPPAPRAVEMPATTTSKLAPPPSIVEDTTRRFDPATERSGDQK